MKSWSSADANDPSACLYGLAFAAFRRQLQGMGSPFAFKLLIVFETRVRSIAKSYFALSPQLLEAPVGVVAECYKA